MNILLHELRMFRRSTITWILSLSVLTGLLLSLYPSFHLETKLMAEILGAFPQMFQDAFGFSPSLFASLIGIYTFFITYITLAGSVQAMNVGTLLFAREISGKTVDFLMTKPVTRGHILGWKILAGLTIILATNLVFLAVASIMALIVSSEPLDYGLFLLLSLIVFFTQMIFFAIGILVSTVARKIKAVTPVSMVTVFGLFIISMFSSAIKDDKLRFLTPFRYFDTLYIVNHSGYEVPFVLLGSAIVIISIAAGFLIYRRRDIHAI